MTSESAEDAMSILSPEEAFDVLGNETRMAIIQVLGAETGPLSFTDLRQRVGLSPGGEFNYHLEKLTNHFVRKTDQGYTLRQPGSRVIEAVLSRAIIETPKLEPTQIDYPCQLCGAPTVVSYREGWVGLYCTDCNGIYGRPDTDSSAVPEKVAEYGNLGGYPLPPAGLQGRTAENVLETAGSWQMSQVLSVANDICPKCTAQMETTVDLCENHDTTNTTCTQCNRRYAVLIHSACQNCPNTEGGLLAHYLLSNTEFLSFLTSNGVNPISPMSGFYEVLSTQRENVVSTDPLEVQLTFSIDDAEITLTVDKDLSVTDVT